ncbi:MAG: FAD-dependent oxidoreductase [Paraclostridium bifermentans]|uniref:FAD-dependent oxidoreductase n=1 Tax=Paraclostridium bifermentans TaxID=1490 RepID=UPI001D8F3807|nr:FAD-dependent oxidoreductase [Paraclostridium bifermentans]MBS6507573.1 FAD-dependent oxidoreductase [Paraclostridium bifermentans]MDU3802131.1 FAD-dependent oxidoreductase [Paraclostridium bifermentans]
MKESYWILSSKGECYEKLKEDLEVDTLIVGGGIVGVTTAYLLSKKGIETAIVDAHKIGYGSSGRNTGKVTSQHGIVYSKIRNKYGLDSAKLYHEGNESAIDLIEEIVKSNNIDCNFERLSSFIYSDNENYIEELEEEYQTCKKLGIDCKYHKSLDIPFDVKGAIEFYNQAQFNPKKYLDALTKECLKLGVKVYEETPIVDHEKENIYNLKTKDGKTIKALNVILASHVPWYDGLNLYFAKEKGERSYLLAGEYERDIPKGMYLSVEDSGFTFKPYCGDGQNLIILGGGDHKVGQCKNEGEIYEGLIHELGEKFKVKQFKCKWSAQDYISFDNIPYIGYVNKKEDNFYVATGFCKWGMTNGTLASMIIRDLICYRESKFEDIFNPSRKGSVFTTEFITQNVNVAWEYISGKLKIGDNNLILEKGESKVVNVDGKRCGAYKDYDGKLYIVDITCTHLGCELTFNSAEKTWDCPCHASRFDYKGNVIEGPALRNLNRYDEEKNDIDPKIL